jgi:hypothetical protein
MSDGRPILGPEALAHLKVPPSGTCWWCQTEPATTGEHKFKRSDLVRLMADDDSLLWGDGSELREIRGKSGITRDRYRVVKFPKSLCESCNNKRSKPFDRAYEVYSDYIGDGMELRTAQSIDFREVFGDGWGEQALALARYYGKHFGCRMVRTGLPIPDSLRLFLDGAADMPDAHMALITTDSIGLEYESGLSISPDFATTDKASSRFEDYVLAAYVGPIGVRYAWSAEGIADEERSQFFNYPCPVLNRFEDELAVIERRPS